MNVKIKVSVSFTVSGSGLEDAMADFDELTVEGLLREVEGPLRGGESASQLVVLRGEVLQLLFLREYDPTQHARVECVGDSWM